MWILLGLLLACILIISIWAWYQPESTLKPINYLYRFDSSPRTNFYTQEERDAIFPVGRELESVWTNIRDEGRILYDRLIEKGLRDHNYLNHYNLNIDSETKRNWTTIPLRLFGCDATENMERCPIIAKILRDHPEIKSCLFSIMEPGKIIDSHTGPYDGLLRYQLALDIPKVTEGTVECYLHVGGQRHEWIEGEGVLFDESNLHGAVNTTSEKRMVLLIDLERPYSSLLFRLLNRGIIFGMGSLPATRQATLM